MMRVTPDWDVWGAHFGVLVPDCGAVPRSEKLKVRRLASRDFDKIPGSGGEDRIR